MNSSFVIPQLRSFALLALLNFSISATSLQAGLIAYWPFDDSATLGSDAIGMSNLTSSGDAQATTGGRFGGGLLLDGDGDFLSGTVAGLPTGNSPYTISAWFKTSTSGMGIVGWGNYGNTRQVNALRLAGNGLLNYWWGVDLFADAAPDNILDDQWHHVAATYDGSTRRIYIDGVEKASDAQNNLSATAENFRIGSTNFAEFFNGTLDEVSIYDNALTADEVQNLTTAASILLVTNSNNDGAGSLRQAIADSITGSIILFESSLSGATITLDGNPLDVDKAVNIDASSLSKPVTINAAGNSRVLLVESTGTVSLNHLVLTGGNTGASGGAILLDGPTSGTVTTLNLKDCNLSHNSAGSNGGAIYADGSGNGTSVTLNLENCIISNNSSGDSGGGLALVAAFSTGSVNATLNACTLSDNAANLRGGAIFSSGTVNGNADLTLNSSTLANNTANFQGGGIYSNALDGTASLSLGDCTLSANSAVTSGGGIFRDGNNGTENLILNNSIVAGNSAPNGPDFGGFSPGTATIAGDNLISNFSGSSFSNSTPGLILVEDALLTTLANFGGSTPTMHPLIDSPALRSGSPTTRTDQRGFTITGPPTIGAVAVPAPTKISNEATLRSELLSANAPGAQGKVICFQPTLDGQTINLSSQLDIPANTDGLMLDASSLRKGITLDAGNAITDSRVLQIGANSSSTLLGLTLTGGQTSEGTDGGGIHLGSDSSLNLLSCTISGNRTGKGPDGSGEDGGSGGGIYLSSGSALTLFQSTVASNQTGAGGTSIAVPGFGGCGGGIYASQGSSLTIVSSTIANNQTGNGGDITTSEGFNFFQGGTGGSGGGISAAPLTSFTILSSTIANNRTGDGGLGSQITTGGLGGSGGGVQVSDSQFFISSSTISGNRTGGRGGPSPDDFRGPGGGIATTASTAEDTIFHSIVAGNFANESGEDNNLLNDDYPLFIGTTSFIEGDAMLSPLGDNGGPTQTMIPLPGSPVIDAATTSTITTDQRGFSRPLDGDNDGTSAPDIGATEAPNWTNPGLADYPSIWPTDLDQDGTDYGVELILGTDPAVSDADSAQNVTLSFPSSSQSNLLFSQTTGLIPAGAKLTVLRSTTLLPNSFEELASYDANTGQTSVPIGSNDTFVLSGNQFSLLDNNRPSANAFYRLESEYNP